MTRRLSPDIESELSQRELQLLVHASRGLTDQAIAIELGISLATIATYWGRIRIKLGPLNRTELVAKYLDYKAKDEIETLQNEVEVLRNQLENSGREDTGLLIALNKMPRSIIILAPDTTVVYVNEATCKWMGYSPDEMVGNSILDFYPEGRHEILMPWMEELFANPDHPTLGANRTAYTRHRDGSIVTIYGDAVVYDTPAGKRMMWITTLSQPTLPPPA
ncbi:MAG: PAS domain S-box protein [Armatimonadetes bacterium]|nr:PAS domain S-box protein [Armatimonadota bacterium]